MHDNNQNTAQKTSPLPTAVAPLQAIQTKEAAIEQLIDAAREQADADISTAQAEADERIAQTEKAAQAAAAARYERAITAANQEADAIKAAAQEQAMQLRDQAAGQIEQVVTQIVQLVLPATSQPNPQEE